MILKTSEHVVSHLNNTSLVEMRSIVKVMRGNVTIAIKSKIMQYASPVLC